MASQGNQPTTVSLRAVDSSVLLGGLALAAGILFLRLRQGLRVFPVSAFLQPDAVLDIAQSLPEPEDEFILSAWRLVGDSISYEPVGSEIIFTDSKVRCLSCFFPAEVLRRRKANCVGASSLLASILLTRLPPDRVSMVIGNLSANGVGGHAWVEVSRYGDWYILEATRSPKAAPWKKVSTTDEYLPSAIISASGVRCADEGVCIKVSDCPCMRGDRHDRS